MGAALNYESARCGNCGNDSRDGSGWDYYNHPFLGEALFE